MNFEDVQRHHIVRPPTPTSFHPFDPAPLNPMEDVLAGLEPMFRHEGVSVLRIDGQWWLEYGGFVEPVEKQPPGSYKLPCIKAIEKAWKGVRVRALCVTWSSLMAQLGAS